MTKRNWRASGPQLEHTSETKAIYQLCHTGAASLFSRRHVLVAPRTGKTGPVELEFLSHARRQD